jgi:Domain of unknown function (DUF1772)
MLAGQLGLLVAALFTGAALYVNVAEQPARLRLDERSLLAEWQASYARGFAMQAPLALLGFALGIAAYWPANELIFLAGAFLMLANWPWTLLAMMPTNKALMAIDREAADGRVRELALRWGRLHAVRTVLGALATVAFLIGLMAP